MLNKAADCGRGRMVLQCGLLGKGYLLAGLLTVFRIPKVIYADSNPPAHVKQYVM